MAKKFYVVWVGRETGIFTNWPYTLKQVHQFPGAKYQSFATQAEAKAAYAGQSQALPKAKSSAKSKTSSVTAQRTSTFDVSIYCDGGCDPNPGKAGSGVAVYRSGQLESLWYGLYNPHGTNNSAELNALHESLRMADEALKRGHSVEVLCDSMYSLNCVSVWAYSWAKKGWQRKTPGDIKNLEIIQQAHALYHRIREGVVLAHVKAHAGTEGNELADRMSIYAIAQKNPVFCAYAEPLEVASILKLRAG